MKKHLFCLVLLLAAALSILAADEKAKFGKISKEELEMKIYENDSTAAAVVLYEEMDSRYEYDPQTFFRVVNRYFVRIKILTNEGLNQADCFIARYVGNTRQDSDVISGLSGYTYNLENGKIEKTELSKEHIFEEKTAENITRTKFAFQSVKPGSIIEYKYELTSPHYTNLQDYYFQRSIPVKYSKFHLQTPEYFKFSKDMKGHESVDFKMKQDHQTIHLNGGMMTFTVDVHDFTVRNLPGLKEEDYVWSVRDYLSRVTFELHSFIIPGVVSRNFSGSWKRVDGQLLNSEGFGKQFNHKFFKEELSTLFTPEMTNEDKVRAIYNMVKTKVKWNDWHSLWVNNPKEALAKGIGSGAEINAILISALREAGFEAFPIAMSLRHLGRVSKTNPTIESFNYFIVAAFVDDKPIYMDAASKYGDLNVMDPSRLSDQARRIREGTELDFTAWVDLARSSKSMGLFVINAKFDNNGVLTGKIQETYTNQLAYELSNDAYSKNKDEQEFFEKKAATHEIEITSHSMKGIANGRNSLEYDFAKKDIVTGDDYIYLNPLIIPLYNENPFKAEERKLPIEFSFPYEKRYSVTIAIPDGYQVKELPESTKITLLEDKNAFYQYQIEEDEKENRIIVSVRFVSNRVIYSPVEYSILRDFFLHLTASNTSQIVLEKIK